jgi:uncharacterized protein
MDPNRLMGIALTAAVVCVLWIGLLFVAQRRLLYFPRRAVDAPSGERLQVVPLTTSAGPVEAIYLPAISSHDGPFPLLIFTHGNAELADDWVKPFEIVRLWECAVLLVEYPGYGRSAGAPTEVSIVETILAAYDWARTRPEIDSSRIVPYGRSLGGGAATRLAKERPVAALILESTFTSIRAFAPRYFAPGFIVRDVFDNIAGLQRYRGPLLIIHGAYDATVPVAHGRALAAAVKEAEYIELPCGHNDCPLQWRVIHTFLAKHKVIEDR